MNKGYVDLPIEIRQAIQRGEIYYLGIEFYHALEDDIFSTPANALMHYSDSRFRWQDNLYLDKIQSIPELTKFIGKTFNTLTLKMLNVERGTQSGSRWALANRVRGLRVAVRIIFPDLEDITLSRHIWWGRVATVSDITETDISINCSQEIGNFSYEVATQKYGSGCPLWFGKGDCLGSETFAQKSLAFQTAFNEFGQGGCNRTYARCKELSNDRFYQGQNIVTVVGQFIRETVTRTGWWIFKHTKRTRVPVQYSTKNQSENDGTNIPIVVGRAKIQLHAITWADIGTSLTAIFGACKGRIEGFFNITSLNPKLIISSVTQHLGEYGGEGTQVPDLRFPQSGYNSKLANLGITFAGSEPSDEGEDVPDVTAVVKGSWIPVRDRIGGQFVYQWSYNPVWITRWFMLNFQYTVVRAAWFNEEKNQNTADYCFTVVEDDTGAEIPTVSASSQGSYGGGGDPSLGGRVGGGNFGDSWYRWGGSGRIGWPNDVDFWHTPGEVNRPLLEIVNTENEVSNTSSLPTNTETQPDVWWGDPFGLGNVPLNRIYLQFRYTTNGVINESAKLSDLLFSLILPTFKGYFRFNHFGKIEIDCRKPADNTYVRQIDSLGNPTTPLGSTEIPVASVEKFVTPYGYLLIGVGKATSEIARPIGVRYVNGCVNTVVTSSVSASLGLTVSPAFIDRQNAASEIYLDFTGLGSIGERVYLCFTEPDGTKYEWDYYIDFDSGDTALIARMFQVRLRASPLFRQTWTAEIFSGSPNRVVIRCQTGYIQIDRQTVYQHEIGEEILRVVEVYEDGKDDVYETTGIRDNLKDFKVDSGRQTTYHGVEGTYISAVHDFTETDIQPRIAWDSAEEERNLSLLDMDLRMVDNYRQAAFLIKSAAIQNIDGNLPVSATTGILGMFHEEGDVVAIRHQTLEGISYSPFSIENIKYDHSNQSTGLEFRLYLSAMFDERVAKEEKFLEATLATNANPNVVPNPTLTQGGYSGTGGAGDGSNTAAGKFFESQKYTTLELPEYSPQGRDLL